MPQHRTYVERVCAHCQQPFQMRADTTQRYCTPACGYAGARVERVTTPCQQCGAPVSLTAAERAHGQGSYCSKACRFPPSDIRFWRYVERSAEPDACWRWVGPSVALGYGRFRFHGKATLAHRVSWLLNRGPIPMGQFVLHRCPRGGVPSCVNPGHLALGTQADNMQDLVRDGRHWSQTGVWHPKQRVRPAGLAGDMREVVVILPRHLYQRLAARAKAEGRSLQEIGLAALTIAAQEGR